ncbi:UDP-N-acetylglucosamine 2-epimerase (non-hydrolyzing) [Candidatus Uhrbacteria bacterium]|nr:UDP-N-acetylglucosamine 2-epimerase (non-hydrolyzing) [Candidatus Uhrbacteria bacterium]
MAKPFTLMTLLGIRPDIIRMHKLIRLLDEGQAQHGYRHVFAHTGQHFDYELDGVFYDQLSVRRPDINLEVGKTLKERGGATHHAAQTALLFERTYDLLARVHPDAVMYLGDTNSVISSVVVAREQIPVIHIEGGGRSFDWRMPEEKCRTIIDHLSDAIYCYLPRYRELLLREGIAPYRITVIGNIIVDAIDAFLPKAEATDALARVGVRDREYCLVTLHREENTTAREVFEPKLRDLMRLSEEMPVVFPFMPRVRANIERWGLLPDLERSAIIVTKPMGFLEFLKLEAHAKVIVSDSGTVQEEACILGVPCVIARRSTERPETIAAGATILSEHEIYEGVHVAMQMRRDWDRSMLNPYSTSPSAAVFEDLLRKMRDGYFAWSRSFEAVGQDTFVAQAYNVR